MRASDRAARTARLARVAEVAPRAQRGCRAATDELLRLMEPLVRWWTGRFMRASGQLSAGDDLAQEGRLAVLHALSLWQESRGVFHIYATTWIRARLGAYLARQQSLSKGWISTTRRGDSAGGAGEEEVLDLPDPAPHPEQIVVEQRVRAALSGAILTASKGNKANGVARKPKLAAGVLAVMRGEATYAEAGELAGVSRQRVQQVHAQTMDQLSSLLMEQEVLEPRHLALFHSVGREKIACDPVSQARTEAAQAARLTRAARRAERRAP